MEDGKDTTHDDTIEDVPATARLLDGGENFTTVVRVESEKNNAIMPEMESADREEKREDRPEMSDILVGCSGKPYSRLAEFSSIICRIKLLCLHVLEYSRFCLI